MARAVIDGGNAAGSSVGRADVDLVSTFVRSPGDMNPAFGSGFLVSSTVRAEAENLYYLGNQLALVVDLSTYPLYALTSQFLTDIEAVVTALAGTGPDYGELIVVLHDGVDGGTNGYQGSTTQAHLTAPLSAVPGGSAGAYTVTCTYASSGTGVPPGIPILQNGDSVYFDEAVGLTGLAAGADGASLPTATTLVTAASNNVGVNTFTGAGVLNVGDASGFTSTGTVVHIDYAYGTAVITYTGKTATTLTGCTTTIITGTTPALNVFQTGDLIWQTTSPPEFVDLTGPFTVSGVSTTGGITTFTAATGPTPVIALTPSVQVPGATPVFGGRLKMDSAAAIAHGDPLHSYTASTYLTALLSNFGSVRTSLWSTFNAATGGLGLIQVGLGLTGMNWSSATLTLPSSITTALGSADFAGLNLSVPMASWSTGVQSLEWAAAQLHGLTTSGQTMVSWFDLYDPAVPLEHDSTHYTLLTGYFQSFLSAVFIDATMTTLTGNGLMAWNWFNDDYLNTADYGTSYATLIAATNRYAQVQHFSGSQAMSAGARIQGTPTAPLSAGARISGAASATLAAGAHVATPGTATLGAGARIVLTPSVPLPAGSRIQAAAASTVVAGGRVQAQVAAPALAAGARITLAPTVPLAAGARILSGGTVTLPSGARIAVAGSRAITAGGWLSITPTAPLAAGARVKAQASSTIAAGAVIAIPNTKQSTIAAGARIKAQASSTLAAGAVILVERAPVGNRFSALPRTRDFASTERTRTFRAT